MNFFFWFRAADEVATTGEGAATSAGSAAPSITAPAAGAATSGGSAAPTIAPTATGAATGAGAAQPQIETGAAGAATSAGAAQPTANAPATGAGTSAGSAAPSITSPAAGTGASAGEAIPTATTGASGAAQGAGAAAPTLTTPAAGAGTSDGQANANGQVSGTATGAATSAGTATPTVTTEAAGAAQAAGSAQPTTTDDAAGVATSAGGATPTVTAPATGSATSAGAADASSDTTAPATGTATSAGTADATVTAPAVSAATSTGSTSGAQLSAPAAGAGTSSGAGTATGTAVPVAVERNRDRPTRPAPAALVLMDGDDTIEGGPTTIGLATTAGVDVEHVATLSGYVTTATAAQLGPALNALYARAWLAVAADPTLGGLVSGVSEGDLRVELSETDGAQPAARFDLQLRLEFVAPTHAAVGTLRESALAALAAQLATNLPAATSRRELVLAAFATRLEATTTLTVERNRDRPFPRAALPAVSFADGDETRSDASGVGWTVRDLSLDAAVLVAGDASDDLGPAVSVAAGAVIAAVESFATWARAQGLAEDAVATLAETLIDDTPGTPPTATARVAITITYSTGESDPTALPLAA